MKNKKAGTKLLSVWWFFVIVVVFIGIIAGVSLFKNEKIDVRTVEAAVLMNRLIDCSNNYGAVNELIFDKKTLFEACLLKQEIIDTNKYFIKISAINISSGKMLKQMSAGNNAFEEECGIAKTSTAKNYPVCLEKIIFLRLNNELIKLNLITGSNYEFGVK
jgi:uncharacterized membrane protein